MEKECEDAIQTLQITLNITKQFDAEHWGETLQLMELLNEDDLSFDLLLCKGDCLCSLGRRSDALARYSKAILLNPTSASARSCRGITYFEMSLYQLAVEDFAAAQNLSEGKLEKMICAQSMAECHYFCGAKFMDEKKFTTAIEEFKRSADVYTDISKHCIPESMEHNTAVQNSTLASFYQYQCTAYVNNVRPLLGTGG